jgi:hypothetical protein
VWFSSPVCRKDNLCGSARLSAGRTTCVVCIANILNSKSHVFDAMHDLLLCRSAYTPVTPSLHSYTFPHSTTLQPHSLTIAFHLLDAMALTCADRPSSNTPVTPSLHSYTFPHSTTPTSFSHHRICPMSIAACSGRVSRAACQRCGELQEVGGISSIRRDVGRRGLRRQDKVGSARALHGHYATALAVTFAPPPTAVLR